MTQAVETYIELYKRASQMREVREAAKLAALSPLHKMLLAGAGGVGLGGLVGSLAGSAAARRAAEEERLRTRNLSFGGGVAAGLLAPSVLKALGKATGVGLSPAGEFTSI